MSHASHTHVETPREVVGLDGSGAAAALARCSREIASVSDAELAPINLDVHRATQAVLGALPAIAPYAATLAQLSPAAKRAFETLKDYALATREANARYEAIAAYRPASDQLQALKEEAMRLRSILSSDAAALAQRGLVDLDGVSSSNGINSYKNLAAELLAYVKVLRGAWMTIRGKTAVTPSDLKHAEQVAKGLIAGARDRKRVPRATAGAARVRQQAFTLMLRAYAEIRRALQFVRGPAGDAESIAPSLYAGRGRRGGAKRSKRAPREE